MLPQFGEKHELSSLTSPSKVLEHRRQFGRLPSAPAPKTVIFCYQSRFIKQLLEEIPHQQCDGCFSKLYFLTDYPGVAVSDFGIGAPVVAAKMEELIAWGVQQFISMGTAGSLQSKAKIGDIVVCEKAIRDEGTSHHYLPPTKYIHAPRRMTNKLQHQLKKADIPFLIGSTWTTDSFYRQTAEEVMHYQKEGVLTVEMEAAALFAVAHFYQVDLGAMFTISDSHADLVWQPHLEEELPTQGLRTLLKTALEASKDN
ncbi:MAG: nucleoside phosphorylase [Verrucomicrobia bacterium]|nr:nucleoside phosphorylase [Verrucomicrobiota bacterium]